MKREEMLDDVRGYASHFNGIDADVAQECGCECGSHDVAYEGYKHGDSYRAFIVCHACGQCSEF